MVRKKSSGSSIDSLVVPLSPFVDASGATYHRAFRRSSKRKGTQIMNNPYIYETEIDDLSPDDSIISHAFVSNDKYVLVLLLSSNGDIHVFNEVGNEKPRRIVQSAKAIAGKAVDPVTISISPDATTVVVGLVEGDILVFPTNVLLDIPWNSPSRSTGLTSPVIIGLSGDIVSPLAVPTCAKIFQTKYPRRNTVVVTNKAGSIYLVDIQSRKCVAELTAPQSIHNVDVIQEHNSTDLLLTGFTGAQWVIPLENNGRGFTEVLSTCIPSEFRQVDPPHRHLAASTSGVYSLNSLESTAEHCNSLSDVDSLKGNISYKVPPETWLVHFTEHVLFVVSKETDLRCAIHFAFGRRLEYLLLRGFPEWRILSFIPLPHRTSQLPACLVVNERGLLRIRQNSKSTVTGVICDFLLRVNLFSETSIKLAAKNTGIEVNVLKAQLVPTVLASLKGRKLTSYECSRILAMATATEIKLDQLLDLLKKNDQEEYLLQELLRVVALDRKNPLKRKVVDLYVKKCESAKDKTDYEDYRQKKDCELSAFLSRHPDITTGAALTAGVPLWKSSCLLALRSGDAASAVLQKVVECGDEMWKNADQETRSQMLACISQLDWSGLTPKSADSLVALLCTWLKDVTSPAYYENALRVANQFAEKFPDACRILYLVASMYLLSMDDNGQKCEGEYRSLSCGYNNSIAITFDDQVMVWGDYTNKQAKQMEASDVPLKYPRKDSSVTNGAVNGSSPDSPRAAIKLPMMPKKVFLEGRPHSVACGTEHALVLTVDGQLYSWGNNRFGQCGVGHCQPVGEPQLLKGDWPPIRSISAGQFHSGFVCEDGSVWMFGWGVWGQLGLGGRSNHNCYVPTQVKHLRQDIVQIVCARAHSLLLTQDGTVLMTGNGSYGQTGLCEDVKKLHTFTKVAFEGNAKIRKISSRFYHSVAISTDERIFEWGRNPQEVKMKMFVMRRVRNANKNTEDKPTTALPMTVPRDDLGMREIGHLLDGKVTELSTGLSHSAVVTDNECLYTWGKALEYQLGHGNKSERCEPHQIFEPSDVKWKHVECGGNHTVAISSSGSVFSWGRNELVQCGVPSEPTGNSVPRKFFYQAKEGAKRCVQLPDDSVFVVRPTLIPDVQAKLQKSGDLESRLDEDELINKLRTSKPNVLQAVSSLLASVNPKSCLSSSIPVGLCHLFAGNVMLAIEQVGRSAESGPPSEALTAISSLVWEIVANHEDVQSKAILTKAFQLLPMTEAQKNSSQLKHLWPNVWDVTETQSRLTADEKMAIVEGWKPSVTPKTSVEVPSDSLRIAPRVRVWSQCGHVEPASVGVATDCTTCAEEWREKVQATMGGR